jgi:hypothetical protein
MFLPRAILARTLRKVLLGGKTCRRGPRWFDGCTKHISRNYIKRACQHTYSGLDQTNITLFVVWQKYSELEGEIGESQEIVVYRSYQWKDYPANHSAPETRLFSNNFFFVWFEQVTSNVWLPGSLQQGIFFGTFQNIQTDPVRS